VKNELELKLEKLDYQENAINSVVKVFEANHKNNFDNSCKDGIRSNYSNLSIQDITRNVETIVVENGIDRGIANIVEEQELTIEMETGTGKTLVYLKSIYELYKHYGFTKFIILVPSVANNFIEEQHPQIMIMTLASFNSEDKILNQSQREDLFANVPFIEAIGRTNPIIIMDEPQEGMDTKNSVEQIRKLNPLFKIRYSATHKVKKNLIYRLTPYDSYKQGLVKKIEVLTVTEKNDEATLKLELSETQNGKGDPKAKLKAWVQAKSGKIEFKNTKWLKVGDNLGDVTNNPSYLNYTITRINKSLRSQKWSVSFSNGTEVLEKQTAGNVLSVWALQLEWLIIRHFTKKQALLSKGIKCLSLIFIDKVANYVSDDPVIKKLFIDKYIEIFPEFNNGENPDAEHINDIQGFYFAQTGKGEYTDSESSMRKNKDVFDAILKDKVGLLNYGDEVANKIEFIFSHSALGVGWDNPNIFNIATLNTSYSEIKKRQEIGRGLRISVNDKGHRVYDKLDVEDEERINQLTVIPNESYETFVTQYQEEIKEVYGSSDAGAGMTHSHKGKAQNKVRFTRNKSATINKAFKSFWDSLSKKTDYSMSFDEEALISRSIEALNSIVIEDYAVQVTSRTIGSISEEGIEDQFKGSESYKQQAKFKNIELEEMVRGLDYHLTNENFPFEFDSFAKSISAKEFVETPNRGVFDKVLIDRGSNPERNFALAADKDDEVICFLKLPSYYKIPTPIGAYNPDFGLVMKRKSLKDGLENEFYFVIETKGTNNIDDKKALKESELYKIRCAVKHFRTIGIDIHYIAPIKEYQYFKGKATQTINSVTVD